MNSRHPSRHHPAAIDAQGRRNPPSWAMKQRRLIDLMNRASLAFVQRYTRPDGTLIWRKEWPGMDGSDDAYEGFVSFPLFYILGGAELVHEMARREWDAITRQFTEYGQVHREFDAYYDWMHHGESYTYLYYLGLASPGHSLDRERAVRFAAMYTGDDPEAPNWDPHHRIIRSPINGSRGPRLHMTALDWVTHRPILANYLVPFEDLPGVDARDPMVRADWNDDAVFAAILEQMNERMVPGDVPLNLNSTSLVTHAFLHTGENRYRQWVLDYLQSWADRTRRNGGIVPDNVGPSGQIGERMKGKWWGGYYGWRWPHGAWIIEESTLIAGSNALLLTGDPAWLDLLRSHLDMLWSLRRTEDGTVRIPVRRGDNGWFDYRPPSPAAYIHLYHLSQSAEDLDRLVTRFPRRENWRGGSFPGNAGSYSPAGWFAFQEGLNPEFPEVVADDTMRDMNGRLERISEDRDAPEGWDIHHWQGRNPVLPEGLVQAAMGTPAAVYHGGLLHARVRYFDPVCQRPGLPEHVAALVSRIRPDGLRVTLVNLDPLANREVVLQAGTFGEHEFTSARIVDDPKREHPSVAIHSKHLKVRLGPSAQAGIEIAMRRYAHTPSYAFPTLS